MTVYFKENVGIRINACLQKNIFLSLRWGQKKVKAWSNLRKRKFGMVVSYTSTFSKTIELNRTMRIKGKQ